MRIIAFDLGVATAGGAVWAEGKCERVEAFETKPDKTVGKLRGWHLRVLELTQWARQLCAAGGGDISIVCEEMSFARSSMAVLSTSASFGVYAATARCYGAPLRWVSPKEWRTYVTGQRKPSDKQVYDAIDRQCGAALEAVPYRLRTHAADAWAIGKWATDNLEVNRERLGKEPIGARAPHPD